MPGILSEFRARFLQTSMGTAKLLPVVLCIRLGFGLLRFLVPEAKHVGISFNGEGLGGSHSYNLLPSKRPTPSTSFPTVGQDRFPEGFVGEFIVVNNLDYPGGGGVQEYLQKKMVG